MPLIHFPLGFGWGHYKISAHLVFETLAFVIGFRYFLQLRKQQPDPSIIKNTSTKGFC